MDESTVPMQPKTPDPGTVFLSMFLEELNGVLEEDGMSRRHRAFIMQRVLERISQHVNRAIKKTAEVEAKAGGQDVHSEEVT
jgi:hypothetical protein